MIVAPFLTTAEFFAEAYLSDAGLRSRCARPWRRRWFLAGPDLEIRSEQTPSAGFQSAASEIGIPPEGLGNRLDQIVAWLDHNSGADAWAITPACFVFGETLLIPPVYQKRKPHVGG